MTLPSNIGVSEGGKVSQKLPEKSSKTSLLFGSVLPHIGGQ